MAGNPYKAMANAKVSDNFTINSNQYIYVTKSELQEHENMETGDLEHHDEAIYFENSDLKASEDDFDGDINSLIRIKQEWIEPRSLKQEHQLDYEVQSPEEEEIVEEEYEYEETEESNNPEHKNPPNCEPQEDQESDEETIATFLTASGKQLALYAVEDSDDVFAVAAYDGSGNPPSQFQFLMKADVERLIGQGAVKTIKKPSSIKQQTYLGDTTSIRNRALKEETHEVPSERVEQPKEDSAVKFEEEDDDLSYSFMESQDSFDNYEGRASMESFDSNSQRSENFKNSGVVTVQNLLYPEDSEYELTFDDIKSIDFNDKPQKIKSGGSMEISSNSSGIKMDISDKSTSKMEIGKSNSISNSNCNSGRANSMDTLKSVSDLMETRSNSLKSVSKTYSLVSNSRSSLMEIDHQDSMEMSGNSFDDTLMDIDRNSSPSKMELGFNKRSVLRRTYQVVKPGVEDISQLLDSGSTDKDKKQTKRSKHMPRALLGCKTNTFDSTTSTVFIHGSTALICCPIQPVKKIDKEDENKNNEEDKDKEENKTPSKLLRPPRKQQLKINDRADSEIIIQPAVIEETLEEVVQPVRKRGRRKKKDGKKDEKTKDGKSRRGRKKKSRIEVIDLGEEEASRHIEEITIDEGKEKGSSDKENDVIMLESEEEVEEEEEEEEEEEDWKCKYCRKSFRAKRAMDTHVRMCPKSPKKIEKKDNEKKYVCKICKETFDVVVALARHTRSHYKKTVVEQPEEIEDDGNEDEEEEEEIVEEVEMLIEEIEVEEKEEDEKKVKKRRVGHFHKKLKCMECRKWFDSMSLLATHYLKHDTKNTDVQMKYCYICRKLIENKVQYLRHMQLHISSKKLPKNCNPKSNSKSELKSRKETSPVQSKAKSPVRRSTRSSVSTTPAASSSKSDKKSVDKKVNSKNLTVRKSNRQKK